MPRSRVVKPAFFKHAGLYDAEVESGLPLRLAFEGLWTIADRAGRFEWKPREIKTDVLPYDPVDFADVLAALERHGFVRRYVVDGRTYGVIPSFDRHQPFHPREAASKLPAQPPEGQTPTVAKHDLGHAEPLPSHSASSSSSTSASTPLARKPREPSEKRAVWLPLFQAVWREKFGGDLPVEKSVRALRKLCKPPNDPGEVLRRWAIYCDAHKGRGEYANAEKFASTYDQWQKPPPAPGNGARGGVAQRTFEAGMTALEDL
jgi:hypothetical protein